MASLAKVHPCDNIDDDDPHLLLARPRPNQPRDSNIIVRVATTLALVLLLLFIFSLAIMTIMWLMLKPRNPTLWLNSLSIPSINTTNSTLTAKYDISLTFKNPNHIWKFFFGEIEVLLIYKNTYDLATTNLVDGLELDREKEKLVKARFVGRVPWLWGDKVLEEIRQDLRKGIVSFNLFIKTEVEGDGPWWLLLRDQGSRGFSCLDVKVLFNVRGVGSSMFMPTQCYEIW
uniref:Late embryogenesis abundant protein LEA-2 subgroup domain-containing protein n=1 Tax=Fagus sylvatica TaxID=28930 RepID=A0A2N9IJ57_FAGSY